MKQLELKTYPDPCLKIKAAPVEEFNDDLGNTVRAMADLMYIKQGIGLAATQVGLGLRIFIVDIGDGLHIFVNPDILERSKKHTKMEEGCLSVPGTVVSISRPETVKIRAQDERGEFFVKTFSGLFAKAVQHEFDHLEGRVIIDHLNPVKYFLASRKYKKTVKTESQYA